MAFKVGKRAKSQPLNPFRPSIGMPITRTYSVCRVTDLSTKPTLLSCFEDLPVRVDCDKEEMFVRELTHVIPKNEIWHDAELGVYQVAHKHLEWVIDAATDYFDEVKVERNGAIESVKSLTRKDLMEKPGANK